MKKAKTDRDRLIGGLGGAGGALLLMMLFEFLFDSSRWESTWLMNLFFVVIGASLVLVAVYMQLRE